MADKLCGVIVLCVVGGLFGISSTYYFRKASLKEEFHPNADFEYENTTGPFFIQTHNEQGKGWVNMSDHMLGYTFYVQAILSATECKAVDIIVRVVGGSSDEKTSCTNSCDSAAPFKKDDAISMTIGSGSGSTIVVGAAWITRHVPPLRSKCQFVPMGHSSAASTTFQVTSSRPIWVEDNDENAGEALNGSSDASSDALGLYMIAWFQLAMAVILCCIGGICCLCEGSQRPHYHQNAGGRYLAEEGESEEAARELMQ